MIRNIEFVERGYVYDVTLAFSTEQWGEGFDWEDCLKLEDVKNEIRSHETKGLLYDYEGVLVGAWEVDIEQEEIDE